MNKKMLHKLLVVCSLTLLICIVLWRISWTVTERASFHDQAVASVAADSVREQTVLGPILVLPYTEEYEERVISGEGAQRRTDVVRHVDSHRLLVFPGELNVHGTLETDRRYRGIHTVLVYSGQHAFAGNFKLPATDAVAHAVSGSQLRFGNPFIAIGIDDVRGIHNLPRLNWNGRQIEFEQGSGLLSTPNGIHAPLAASDLDVHEVRFSFDLALDGIENMHFVPVANSNAVTFKSNWPHPQFGGRFLPASKGRRISDTGFEATWTITALASDAQPQILSAETPDKAGKVTPGASAKFDRFSVGLVEPVNIYSQVERANKYGLLFVSLTFGAFFFFEMLKRLPIHPVQYLLVGLALALFFLLLMSLSEHIAFALAYLIASTACIALIGFYLGHVLRDRRRGFGFGVGLTALYGALYGLLISENNALLMGSLLLFGILATTMVVTRKVDWYQID